MHGVRRVKQNPEAIQARKEREKGKINDFLALTDIILARKKKSDWSREAFDLTTRMLSKNPEFYTVWNYRRNILWNGIFPTSSLEEINNLLSADLSMTTAALKEHPKVYWIWNHRRWCLSNVPQGPGTPEEGDLLGWQKSYWDKEIFVVEKMLDMDPRNFHAWDYRRYVLANMPGPRSKITELVYTTKKIESNFSNFSAWHQRSKVLTSLWADGSLDPLKSREDEFLLIRNAMFTDPNDQSVWLYHRWLIGSGKDKDLLESEIAVIQELLDEQQDSKWCMESLVHYKSLLMTIHTASVQVDFLRANVEQLLQQLIKLDPARRNRYYMTALTLLVA